MQLILYIDFTLEKDPRPGPLFEGNPVDCNHQAPPSMGFSGKNTGVGCHFLLQGIFPNQGSNPGLPHCRQTLYRLNYAQIALRTFGPILTLRDTARAALPCPAPAC